MFYSCGKDGSFYVWNVKDETVIPFSDSFENDPVKSQKIESKGETIKYYEEIIEEEYLEKMKSEINKKKKAQFDKLEKIKRELQELLAENSKHNELERLDRDEFAIDLESKQKVTEAGQQ